jgi:ATP-binding cassette subfamily C (CFTR/MRP) protein 10
MLNLVFGCSQKKHFQHIYAHSKTSVQIILAMFGIINSLFTLGRAFSFAFGGLRAAIHIHASLLENIISAPICFFDQNPSGRILNRFGILFIRSPLVLNKLGKVEMPLLDHALPTFRLSSDLYTVDDSLPFIINIFVANFFSLLGTLVVLSYSQVNYVNNSLGPALYFRKETKRCFLYFMNVWSAGFLLTYLTSTLAYI